MEDLSMALNELLASEEGMKKLGEVAGLLGLGGEEGKKSEESSQAGNGNALLSGLLASLAGESSEENGLGGIDMGKVMMLLSKLKEEDKNISLLNALKPHLKDNKKVDEAIKILKILRVLPTIKEMGILDGGLF